MNDMRPDHSEEQLADYTDNLVPTRGYQMLPVVGLGGSAGGLDALRGFFSAMPPNPGLAFVVVMHLSPEHDSVLAEVLQRCTSMRVLQVQQTEKVEPDTVYVIPPGKSLRTFDGYLQLGDLPKERYRHVAVDIFFRTLADTHGPHATAIVLSGADGDGAVGIKRIKERGGLTIAQDPQEAQVDSMPRAAIATGMMDWTLPVAEMPAHVLQYHSMERDLRLPPETAPAGRAQLSGASADEAALRDVLSFVRSRTGRDFSNYKRATIVRRIGRRMQVNNVRDVAGYLDCLRTRPGEAGALLQDLLISVTNFFRDGECFAALESHIPSLFEGKSGSDTVRVWVAGCATGEEAYSIAMLLTEHARMLDTPPALQVFATDLDDNAIRVAREGIYPSAIVADVSEDRLRRFFIKEHRGYRARRELRETVLFAVHDVLRDSPFSRLDLVSCRNLLIYLDRHAQTRVLDTFHFALQPSGMMFLGTSESVDDGSQHFDVVDKKHRLFRRKHVLRSVMPLPMAGPQTLALALDAQATARSGPVIATAASMRPAPEPSRATLEVAGRVINWAEVHLKLLEQLAPPSLVVDAEHEILHMSPLAGRFLAFAGGEPTRNLLKLIHPALRIELRAALYKASHSCEPAYVLPAAFDLAGEQLRLGVEVRSMADTAPGLLLVLFNASGPDAEPAAPPPQGWVRPGADPVADQLDREVERLKSHLRDTVEQYEASTEELKASNEELQAINEELRSATEELETSREELQSINEELTTVNHELKSKVEELGHANSDMQNLMGATAIATVFLDRDLHITRYTPSAVKLFNLMPSDIGRPLAHLHTQLRYPELVGDARGVLEQLTPIERQVSQSESCHYLARLLPYRTLDDRIAGVVLTFVDISERVQGAEALRQSESRFSAIVNQATVGVVQAELDGRILFANQHYAGLLGYSPDELVGTPLLALVHPDDREESAARMERLASQGEQFQMEKRCLRKDQTTVWLHNTVSALCDAAGEPVSAIVVCTDISERKRAEAALRDSNERLSLIIENAVEYAIFSTDLDRRITTWNSGAQRLLGYTEREALGQLGDIIFIPEERAAGAPEREAQTALTEGKAMDDRVHQRKDGQRFWASGATMPMQDASGATIGLVKILRDQSAQRASQQALEQSRAELLGALKERQDAHAALQAADEAKDRFLAVLSHELRNPLASISSASMAMRSARLAESDRERAAEIVQRQAQVMKVLLDDLLDVSRLRLNRLVLQPQPVLLSTVVESALEAAGTVVQAAGHVLEVHLPAAAVSLNADPVRLSQVLSNLLINAAKYTPDGGRIELSAALQGGEVVISVKDNGIGMDPASVEAMFDMFSQSPAAAGRGMHGLGIGLALVRSIVSLHAGHVTGHSDGLGQGSVFTVTLPVLSVLSAQSAQPTLAGNDASAQPIAKARVLLVDDNADVTWSVARLLTGCDVATATSGPQALQRLRTQPFDVAVLDLGMPEMSGFEVARAIRAESWGAGLLLVAASGWGQDEDRRAAREAGFDAHLVKPVDVQDLLRLIAQHHPRNQGLAQP